MPPPWVSLSTKPSIQNMNFTVTVPVKPYVKRFIENNYGCPVDFRNHPRENEMFRRMLKKPCRDGENKFVHGTSPNATSVEILVPGRSFDRYGWELSKTDTVRFGKHFEARAKLLMRTAVGTYVSFGAPTNIAIAKFQERFNMEEEYWPWESILKDFMRFRKNNGIDFNHYAFRHLERLILVNMEVAGNVTDRVVKKHHKMAMEQQ